MEGEADPLDRLSVLVRSRTRVEILERLASSGATTQRELRDCLDASRSTIVRALSALERQGWIERTPESYRITTSGEFVAEGLDELLETVRLTEELSAFLEWFPHGDVELDPASLRDAEVTTSTPSDPYAPARTQTEFVRAVGRFVGFLPAIDLEGTKIVRDRIANGELTAEIVIPDEVAETVRDEPYAPLFRDMFRTGRLSVLVVDRLPFYLGLDGDDRVQIGVADEEGIPRALLETNAEPARSWAEAYYSEHRNRGRELSIEGL